MEEREELEITFENNKASDLEDQVIKIMKKYADIKCKELNDKRKKIKERTENKKSILYKSGNDSIEQLNDEQLMNYLGISKRNLNKCY